MDQIAHKHCIGDCLQYDKSVYLLPFFHVFLILRFYLSHIIFFLNHISPIMCYVILLSLLFLPLSFFPFVSLTLPLFLVLQSTNSLGELLSFYGLGQYTDILLENGYDNISFMNDISLDDLKEIGVASHQDRERVSNYNSLLSCMCNKKAVQVL